MAKWMYDTIYKKVRHIKLHTMLFRDIDTGGGTIIQCHGLPLDGNKGITIPEGF